MTQPNGCGCGGQARPLKGHQARPLKAVKRPPIKTKRQIKLL